MVRDWFSGMKAADMNLLLLLVVVSFFVFDNRADCASGFVVVDDEDDGSDGFVVLEDELDVLEELQRGESNWCFFEGLSISMPSCL